MLPREALRILKRALENEPSDRIDIDGSDLAPEPHGLQRNRAPASKWISTRGRPAAVRLTNLLPKPIQVRARFPPPVQYAANSFGNHLLVDLAARQVLLLHDLDDLATQLFQELVPLLFVARIRQQGGDQRRACSRKWPPRGPDMQRGDVPVPHVLFVHRIKRCLLQRERDLNQSLVVTIAI